MNKRQALAIKPVPPAVVTDIQRLDSWLFAAAYRLREAKEELHRAQVAHREAGAAVDAELRRLARAAQDREGAHD